jgi:hypothetical protein
VVLLIRDIVNVDARLVEGIGFDVSHQLAIRAKGNTNWTVEVIGGQFFSGFLSIIN